MKKKITIVVMLVLGLLGKTAAQVPEYDITDLGTLGGDFSWAYGINDQGQVVGSSLMDDNPESERAFLYSNGAMKNLGTLGTDFTISVARGINNRGEVIGYSNRTRPTFQQDAFLYSNGAMLNLGTLLRGGLDTSSRFSDPYGINDRGQVVGHFFGAINRAFLYSDGSMKEIRAPMSIDNLAKGINNNGQVVGHSFISDAGALAWRGFIYSDGVPFRILPTLGRDHSVAKGINDNGQVIGDSWNDSRNSAVKGGGFIYSDGVMQDLGTLGGNRTFVYGINNNGHVVGTSEVTGDSVHPFLYSNGVMRNLNNLINKDSGWRLETATAINNKGQIVGSGYKKPFSFSRERALLLNPISSQWKTVSEAKPVQPIYTTFPVKEDGKDSLVVVTHGWIPKEDRQTAPPNPDWVDDMVKAIRQNLQDRGLKNWQVEPYKWTEKAWLKTLDVVKDVVLENGEKEGGNLGNIIASQGWNHTHFISHSAGAAVIEAATLVVKSANINTVVHTTFLDPYVGFNYKGKSKYGLAANWADSYFVWDLDTHDYLLFGRTASKLDHAYNIDVVWLDPKKVSLGRYRSTAGGGIEECFETVTSHDWPRDFYKNTIPLVPLNAQLGSEGFGFPLSKEGGNWDFALANYSVYTDPIRELGIQDKPCPLGRDYSIPVYPSWLVNFKQNPLVTSVTGIIQNNGNGLIITSGGRLQQQSIRKAVTSSEPAWAASSIVVTNTANIISFDAEFLSTKAQGLFTAYWETNVIGSIDERVVLPGLQRYTYALPSTITNNSYTLGFRLDSFLNTVSSISITNVSLGFVGIPDSFSLSFTGKDANGFNLLKLTGPSGFDYSVEASTNLIDWKTMAVLVNTNGTVSFVDRQSTNSTARFYRAVGH